MSDPLQQRIQQADQAIDQHRARANAAMREMFVAVAKNAAPWVRNRARVEITERQSSVTTKVQPEQLKTLKGEIETRIADLPAKVEMWLRDEAFWPHLDPRAETKSDKTLEGWSLYGNNLRSPHVLRRALDQALRKWVAGILKPYGYHFDEYGLMNMVNEEPSWEGEPDACAARYIDAMRGLREALKARDTAVKDKSINDATALFDGA